MDQVLNFGPILLIFGAIVVMGVYLGVGSFWRSPTPGPRHSFSAYGLDLRGKTVELGPVSRAECRALVDERFALVGRICETGEEALANGIFGFQRSDTDYIEIDLIGASMMTIRAGQDAIGEDFEEQVKLDDIKAVKALVDLYSDQLADFAAYWQRLDNRSRCR